LPVFPHRFHEIDDKVASKPSQTSDDGHRHLNKILNKIHILLSTIKRHNIYTTSKISR
jgi:hypothetical protein